MTREEIINRQGEIVGKYDKVHPTASEIWGRGREAKYSFEFAEPYIVEIEGLRFAFLTCYEEHSAHAGCHTGADSSHLRADKLHGVVDAQTCIYATTRGVEIDIDITLRIYRVQV